MDVRRKTNRLEERAQRIIAAMERRPAEPQEDPGPPPKRHRPHEHMPPVTAGYLIGDHFVSAAELAYWTKAPLHCRERACRRARSCRGQHNRCAFLIDTVGVYAEAYRRDLCD